MFCLNSNFHLTICTWYAETDRVMVSTCVAEILQEKADINCFLDVQPNSSSWASLPTPHKDSTPLTSHLRHQGSIDGRVYQTPGESLRAPIFDIKALLVNICWQSLMYLTLHVIVILKTSLTISVSNKWVTANVSLTFHCLSE